MKALLNPQLFRLLCDSSRDIHCFVDLHGKIEYLSSSGERLFECDESAWTGLSIYDSNLDWQRQLAPLRDFHRNILAGSCDEVFELELLCNRGKAIWFECGSDAVNDPERGLIGVHYTMRDISARKQMEANIARKSHMDGLISRIAASLAEVGPEESEYAFVKCLQEVGEFLGVDSCYVFLFDDTCTSVVRSLFWHRNKVIAADELSSLTAPQFPWIIRQLNDGIVSISDVNDIPAEGIAERKLWQSRGVRSIMALPIFAVQHLIGFLGVATNERIRHWTADDVDFLRVFSAVILQKLMHVRSWELMRAHELEMRKKLLLASRLSSIGTLAGGVAHEINNPLAIIIGYVWRLREELKHNRESSSEISGILDSIEHASLRINEIVSGLNAYVHTDLDRIEDVDIHQVILETISLVEKLYLKRGIRVKMLLRCRFPFVRGNASRLQQVIMNLLNNAREALEKKGGDGTIRIVTADDGDRISMRVIDSGCGIDASHIDRVFDPFFTTKDPGMGAGLDLSICHSVVTSLGGEISVRSTVSKGTAFDLRLPRIREPKARES